MAEKIEEILYGREQRWLRRMELAQNCETLLSVSLCIPLPFRAGVEEKNALRSSCEEIEKMLLAHKPQ